MIGIDNKTAMRIIASELMKVLAIEVHFFQLIYDDQKTVVIFRVPDETGELSSLKYDDDGTIAMFLKNTANDHLSENQTLDYIRVTYDANDDAKNMAKIFFTENGNKNAIEFKY